MKQTITWFDSREAFYLGQYVKEIDEDLLNQKPLTISYLKYLKASELRSWLLYYSLPLLLHRLPTLYFQLFVAAIHFLLQSISTDELLAAEELLKDYVQFLPELYGERSMH